MLSIQIVYNPGTSTNSAYFSSADLIVTDEVDFSTFSTSDLTISSSEPASKQAVLLYNAGSSSPTSLIDQLGSLGVGTVYVTGDTLPNPWDTVPTFWAAEMGDIAAA